MELKDISLAQLLNNTSGTEYFSTFAKLIGHNNNTVFYEGITDEHYYLLEELEKALGYELPSRYIEFLSYLNGGSFLNIELFSLADSDYPNSLYARNISSSIKEKLNLDPNVLIIGRFESYVMYINCLDADGSYTLMDIRNNEKIEFESFNSLIGFIFYVLVITNNKNIEKEKEQIQEMKEKLHKDIVNMNKKQKKEKEQKLSKLRAKAAAKALKEKQKRRK